MHDKVTPLPLDPNRLGRCNIGGRIFMLVIPPIVANQKRTGGEVIPISAKPKKRKRR
jgi:hypothetical protein